MNVIDPKALWHGLPTRERQEELETQYYCDWRGERGCGWGAIFQKIRGRWVLFTDYKPVPDFWRRS